LLDYSSFDPLYCTLHACLELRVSPDQLSLIDRFLSADVEDHSVVGNRIIINVEPTECLVSPIFREVINRRMIDTYLDRAVRS